MFKGAKYLEAVWDELRRKYPSLVFIDSQSSRGSPFVHIMEPKFGGDGLEFLPNFHVVAVAEEGGKSDALRFLLLTYSGKVLQEELLKPGRDVELLDRLSRGSLTICRGVKRLDDARSGGLTSDGMLLETFGDVVTVRSGDCTFVGKGDVSRCEQCSSKSEENCDLKAELVKMENDDDDHDVECTGEGMKVRLLEGFSGISVAIKPETRKEAGEAPKSSRKKKGKVKKGKSTLRKRKRRRRRPVKAEGTKTFRCEVCCLVYVERYRYMKCMERHEEVFDLSHPVKCPLCRVEIPSKLEVTSHFSDHHSDESKTCCCECLKVVCDEEGELRWHILKEHHSAIKAYLCSECGKEYKSSDNLQAHIRQIHQNITSFVCSFCGDTFARLNTLKSHALSHKPPTLKCCHCGKMFRKKELLIKHLQLHTKFKPLKCGSCNYTSDRRGNIRLHFVKSHRKKWTGKDMEVNEEEWRQMRRIVLKEANTIVAEARMS